MTEQPTPPEPQQPPAEPQPQPEEQNPDQEQEPTGLGGNPVDISDEGDK
jgi:hypothetical protein